MMPITVVRLMTLCRWEAIPHQAFSVPMTKQEMLERCLTIKCFKLVAVTQAMRKVYHIDILSITNIIMTKKPVRDFESLASLQYSKIKTTMVPTSFISLTTRMGIIVHPFWTIRVPVLMISQLIWMMSNRKITLGSYYQQILVRSIASAFQTVRLIQKEVQSPSVNWWVLTG